MNPDMFGEFKTGQLVPITDIYHKRPDWAFIPRPLPPGEFEMADETWQLLTEAYGAICELNGACQNLPHPMLIVSPLQRQEAIKSSRLEGTYATPAEFLFAELEWEQGHSSKASTDATEVGNYFRALRSGIELVNDDTPIGCGMMLKLHRTLMQDARGGDKRPGEFRTAQNFIVSKDPDRNFNPPPARQAEICLDELEQYLRLRPEGTHPLIQAFLVHYQFETIHPFLDGNGRVGRVLLALCIWKWLGLSTPWLYMSEYFYKNRSAYRKKLFQVSASGEWREWIHYCLVGAREQAMISTKRVTRLNDMRRRYHEEVSTHKRLPGIVDELFMFPILRIATLMRKFGVHYRTARADIAKLERKGIVGEISGGKTKGFMAFEIADVAFEDDGSDELDRSD